MTIVSIARCLLAGGVVLGAAGAIGAAKLQAQTPAPQTPSVDVDAVGPQTGQKAIAFRLSDQDGRARDLASVAGPKGTMLVFFRSADW